MIDPRIGIKLADGTFYPVLSAGARGVRRKVTLSTNREDQKSVRIDVYREYGTPAVLDSDNLFQATDGVTVPQPELLAGPEFVASLIIENVSAGSSGFGEVVLVLGIDSDGNLNATATDAGSGEYQSLSVSLLSETEDLFGGDLPDLPDDIGEMVGSDVPDGELSDLSIPESASVGYEPAGTDDWADSEEFEREGTSSPEDEWDAEPATADAISANGRRTAKARKVHPAILAGYIVFCLAVLALLAFLVFRWLEVEASPGLQAIVQHSIRVSTIETIRTYS